MKFKRTILFVILMVLFNACGEDSTESSGDNISLSKGLVAHYEFEGNALDSSGNENHGEEHGGVSYVDGVIGKASKFNGSMDEYITAPNSESLSVQNQLSISVWAKIDIFVFGTDPIVTKGHRSEDYTLWVTAKGESLLLNWNTYQEFWEVDDENIEINKWVYLTTTYDGNSVKYFINGVKTFEKEFNLAIQNSNEPLYIGSSYPGGQEYFRGLIDDLRIYNRALNESEIKELYRLKNNHSSPEVSTIEDTDLTTHYKGDATKDFSTQHNPNNEWSYGTMTSSFTDFKLLSITNSDGIVVWMSDTLSNIWINTTNAIKHGIRPNELTLHPSSGEAPAVLRWTAPKTAIYNIAGEFGVGDVGTMQVGIRKDNDFLFQATDYGEFDLTLSVNAQETIDFVVYGGYYYGSTSLDLKIVEQ